MYVSPNCKSKKELKERVTKGERISVFAPGLGSVPSPSGQCTVEGPHYPKSHTWYATVQIEDDIVVSVDGKRLFPQ